MLILSLFPGIGLLDRAFEEVWPEACIVRGPDKLWGGDVKTFHPPTGVFGGVIGGPPCPAHSPMRYLVEANGGTLSEDLIPEFERVVAEATPDWFVMENSIFAPEPRVPGYAVAVSVLENRLFGGEQARERRIAFGIKGSSALDLWRWIETEVFQPVRKERTVLAGEAKGGIIQNLAEKKRGVPREQCRPFPRVCELQGLPSDFLADAPFTKDGKYRVVGNGVPLMMGRAIAKAVRAAVQEADGTSLRKAA